MVGGEEHRAAVDAPGETDADGFVGGQRGGLGIADRQMKLAIEANAIQREIKTLMTQLLLVQQDANQGTGL